MFGQGDRERALGMPIQALNDRERENIAFSQVGFIEYLVAPLQFGVAQVLPPMEPYARQMVENARNWQKVWLSETHPELEKSALEERLAKFETKYLSPRY